MIKYLKEIINRVLFKQKLKTEPKAKYLLFKVPCAYGRAIFFLAKNPKEAYNTWDYGRKEKIEYAVDVQKKCINKWEYRKDGGYYTEYIYKEITTFKDLIKIARKFTDRNFFDEVMHQDFTPLLRDENGKALE